MRILLLAASALALSIGTSDLSAQGRGGGGPKAERGQGGGGAERGNRGGGQRAERGNRGGGGGSQMVQRGGGSQEARGGGRGQQRQAARAQQRGPDREVRGNGNGRGNGQARMGENRGRGGDEVRGNGNRGQGNVQDRGQQQRFAAPGQQKRERQGARLTQRRAAQVADPNAIARLNWEPTRGLVDGCPPGLAKKYNGCMPPGQLRQQLAQQQVWYDDWWNYPQAANYVYDDGYLYRLDGSGGISNYIPLLGGALWQGSTWPEAYEAYPVADYHLDYFGLDNGYDYRFADGAIYGVDPNTQLIQQIAALIAGDEWAVGQRMPDGYGVYNVPYEFRDQYQDTPDAMYRYSDGYVYQVDPTTQLIQAAIQLIT
jgi:hypothetical protein